MDRLWDIKMVLWLRDLWIDESPNTTILGSILVFVSKIAWSCVITVFWTFIYVLNALIALIAFFVFAVVYLNAHALYKKGTVFHEKDSHFWDGLKLYGTLTPRVPSRFKTGSSD